MLRPETPAEHAFRLEVRDWLSKNLDKSLRDLPVRPQPSQMCDWYRRLRDTGWLVPHWPRAYGGMEATPVQQLILIEEQAAAGVPDMSMQGINHIGPILIRFGTEAQKQRHLPGILSGEVIWCQGYSELGAGSDLNSLHTRAIIDGDHLVINGSKIWTTLAHYSQWMFALVRTGAPEGRRNAITFILIDMATPGITCRPIKTIAGEDELAEVFFDNVPVPIENVVGSVGQGWTIATALLNEERLRGSHPGHALKALYYLRRLATFLAVDQVPVVQDRIAALEIEVEAVSASYLDAMEASAGEDLDSTDSSFIKILGMETTQRITEAMQDIAGPFGALQELVAHEGRMVDFTIAGLQARRLSIMGGTSEIQRSLIASRVLQLPRGGSRV